MLMILLIKKLVNDIIGSGARTYKLSLIFILNMLYITNKKSEIILIGYIVAGPKNILTFVTSSLILDIISPYYFFCKMTYQDFDNVKFRISNSINRNDYCLPHKKHKSSF